MNKPLTTTDAVRLSTIVEAAIHNWTVARLIDDLVLVGTARSIGDERGNFPGPDDDVRDEFLHVTLYSGFEAFWPVSELMEEVGNYFVAPYEATPS